MADPNDPDDAALPEKPQQQQQYRPGFGDDRLDGAFRLLTEIQGNVRSGVVRLSETTAVLADITTRLDDIARRLSSAGGGGGNGKKSIDDVAEEGRKQFWLLLCTAGGFGLALLTLSLVLYSRTDDRIIAVQKELNAKIDALDTRISGKLEKQDEVSNKINSTVSEIDGKLTILTTSK